MNKRTDIKLVKIVVYIILLSATFARAEQMLGPTYDISVPAGETRSFIKETSILGFGLDSRKMYRDNFSIGINFHWNSFKENGLGLIEGENKTTVTVEDRSMDLFPLMLSGHYYFGNPVDQFRIFIGANAGVYFNISRYTQDKYRYVNKTWHFGIAPEAGFLIDFIHDIKLMGTVRYNHGFATSSSDARSWFNIFIGFVTVSLF